MQKNIIGGLEYFLLVFFHAVVPSQFLLIWRQDFSCWYLEFQLMRSYLVLGSTDSEGGVYGLWPGMKLIVELNGCVVFDSGCVRRQMDNFVQDLISAHHDCNLDNSKTDATVKLI